MFGRCSGLPQHIRVWSRPPIVVSSSMVSLVSSSPRMVHLYHYGCGRSFLISTVRPRTKNLLGFQLLRLSCFAVFGISFFVAIATFKGFAGFKNTKPLGLWIVYIIWPLVCTVIYVISQLILVFRTLEDRWPIGDIIFGTAFFAIAQILLFAFSATICDAIKHYIDGLFFFTLCMLLSVMMVYKYWDSITVRGRVCRLVYSHTHPVAAVSARTSSFQLAPRQLCGRSRTHSWPRRIRNTWRMPRAITMGHQAASWVGSVGSSFTSRRDTVDVVVTHHRQIGINQKDSDRIPVSLQFVNTTIPIYLSSRTSKQTINHSNWYRRVILLYAPTYYLSSLHIITVGTCAYFMCISLRAFS